MDDVVAAAAIGVFGTLAAGTLGYIVQTIRLKREILDSQVALVQVLANIGQSFLSAAEQLRLAGRKTDAMAMTMRGIALLGRAEKEGIGGSALRHNFADKDGNSDVEEIHQTMKKLAEGADLYGEKARIEKRLAKLKQGGRDKATKPK